MNLLEFVGSPLSSLWIEECGLEYYVRKSRLWPGAIELASVHNYGNEGWGLWQFLKRHSGTTPFYMEQVLNPRLAAYMRRLRWLERDVEGTPHFGSPLLAQLYSHTPRFKFYWPDPAAAD